MPDLFTPDQPASTRDDFNRLPFAKALAAALMQISGEFGLVIGLEGGWGTGKSSIIEFLKRELAERSTSDAAPVIVNFNPWMVSNTGALVDTLITQIAAAVSAMPGKYADGIEVGEKLLGYVGLLKHLKHLKYLKYVPGAGWIGNLADDIGSTVEAHAEELEDAGKGMESLKKTLTTLDIARRREQVIGALRKYKRPIIVIVDDLDRLHADEIRLIVQTIKAVADFPGTTYLLAYDREVVARALGSGNIEAGIAYLEKIVQVVYPIPPIFRHQLYRHTDRQIRDVLTITGNGQHAANKDDARLREGLKLVTRFMRQPRDIVRLRNRLVLSLAATTADVDATDVIVLEALSQRFPEMRDKIHRYPTDFISYGFREDNESDDDSDMEHPSANFGQHLPPEGPDAELARAACEFLFTSTRDLDRHPLRVMNRDRLARYFHMTSLDSVPDPTTIKGMLENPDELEEFFNEERENDGKSAIYLQWMLSYLPTYGNVDVAGVIRVMSAELAHLVRMKRLTGELTSLFASAMSAMLMKADRQEAMQILSRQAAGLPLQLLEIIIDELKVKRRRAAAPEDEAAHTVEEQLLDDWSMRVAHAVDEGAIQDLSNFPDLLLRYARVNENAGYAYRVMADICSTNDGLAKFLQYFDEHDLDTKYLQLIQDPGELVAQIRNSSQAETYAWLIDFLANDENAARIRNYAALTLRYEPNRI